MPEQETCARTRGRKAKRTNRNYGTLVKAATEAAGVSIWMVYAVLAGRAKSKRVSDAIALARAQARERRAA